MKRRTLLATSCALPLALTFTRAFPAAREPTIGGPCDGCDWVFDGQPSKLDSTSRIAPVGQRGTPMTLTGVVTNAGAGPRRISSSTPITPMKAASIQPRPTGTALCAAGR